MKVQFEEPDTHHIGHYSNCDEERYVFIKDTDGVKHTHVGSIDEAVDSPLRIWGQSEHEVIEKLTEHMAEMYPELFPLDKDITIVSNPMALAYHGEDPTRVAKIEKEYIKVLAFLGTPLKANIYGHGYQTRSRIGFSMSDIRFLYNSINSTFVRTLNPNAKYLVGTWNVPYLIALLKLADKHGAVFTGNLQFWEARLKILKLKGAEKRLSTKDAKAKRLEMIKLLKVYIALIKKSEQNKSIKTIKTIK